MKTIDVSDEMYDALIELSKEINSQDNRSTAMPYFFQIRTKEEVAVPDGFGEEVWVLDDNVISSEDKINKEIFDYKDEQVSMDDIKQMSIYDKEEILETMGYRKFNRDFKDKYENAFLTAKACREHIERNHYHYKDPVDYLSYAFRNPELELVFQFLCGLTNGKIRK